MYVICIIIITIVILLIYICLTNCNELFENSNKVMEKVDHNVIDNKVIEKVDEVKKVDNKVIDKVTDKVIEKVDDKVVENKAIENKTTMSKYEDIKNFQNDIHELRTYNQLAYKEIVNNITRFIDIHKDILEDKQYIGHNIELLEDIYSNIKNALRSFIHTIPVTHYYIDKVNRFIIIIDNILSEYIEELKIINSDIQPEANYSVSSKLSNIPYVKGYDPYKKDDVYNFF